MTCFLGLINLAIIADSQGPGVPGTVVGLVLQTLIGVGLARTAFRRAALARFPNRGPPDLQEMAAIVARHRAAIPETEPAEAPAYAQVPNDQLLDVYDRIKPEKAPERFQALLWTMATRVSAAKPAAPTSTPRA
ncbi:hypothetical protein DRW03_33235 [Corallococcus sp. H22C18031201]|nr:hypothetical protein DRW03_33235 [Corallococcus sp. H22C18031201]